MYQNPLQMYCLRRAVHAVHNSRKHLGHHILHSRFPLPSSMVLRNYYILYDACSRDNHPVPSRDKAEGSDVLLVDSGPVPLTLE